MIIHLGSGRLCSVTGGAHVCNGTAAQWAGLLGKACEQDTDGWVWMDGVEGLRPRHLTVRLPVDCSVDKHCRRQAAWGHVGTASVLQCMEAGCVQLGAASG